MENDILAGRIRKKSMTKMLIAIPVLVVGILLLYVLSRDGLLSIKGYFTPYEVKSLKEIDAVADHVFFSGTVCVSLTAAKDDIIDAGIDRTEDGATVGSFVGVAVDNKFVLCYLNNKDYQKVFSGSSYTFTGSFGGVDPEAKTMVLKDMVDEGIGKADAEQALYGYMLDTTDNGVFARTLTYLFVLAFWAISIFLFLRGFTPFLNVNAFPQVKKLAKYGPVDVVLPEIERQFAEAGEESVYKPRGGANKVYLLKDWIVVESPLNFRFMRAEELLWAYKTKNTTKYYGVITVGVRFFATLCGKGAKLLVKGDELSIDRLLAAVVEKYPWAVAGFSDKLAAIWRTDVGQFVAHAKEKLDEIRGGSGSPPSIGVD